MTRLTTTHVLTIGTASTLTAGSYAVVCFIPVGSVGETEGDGHPHFTEGMIHEFTVSS